MSLFSFEELEAEYKERVGNLRTICTSAAWPQRKAWLESTDLLLTRYSMEELTIKLLPYIRPMGAGDVETIKLVELSREFCRNKLDFPSRISEYSNIIALYYRLSEAFKEDAPEEAAQALLGAIRVLMKLIGVLEAIEIAHIQGNLEKKKMTARGNGGRVKSERYDSVKQEIIRLFQHKGAGQYAAKQAAAEDILEDAWQFSHRLTEEINAENKKLPTSKQTRKAPGLVRENLIRQMLDWSRKDAAVSEAFNRVIKPR
ncbi:hypothetical protein NMD14_17220 [Aeromonas veronii]